MRNVIFAISGHIVLDPIHNRSVPVESLTRVLTELEEELHGAKAAVVTLRITDAIRKWAEAKAWMALREVPVVVPNGAGLSRQRGFYDLVVERPDGPRLAIEIDRANKRWSAEKLGLAVAQGMIAIWVRWAGEPPQSGIVLEGVDVIKLNVKVTRHVSGLPRGWHAIREQSGESGDDVARLIRSLKELNDAGVLSDDEFRVKRAELLKRLGRP